MKKLLIVISTILIISILSAFSPANKGHKQQIESYDYVITKIDSTGIYGHSVKDSTGIYLTHENVKGIHLESNNYIRVYFPKNDYETILKVKKIKTITQKYKVIQVYNNHVTTISEDNNNLVIDFYYDDQIKPEQVKYNDTIATTFKPYKNSYKIVNWTVKNN